jgi:hypothetical protein
MAAARAERGRKENDGFNNGSLRGGGGGLVEAWRMGSMFVEERKTHLHGFRGVLGAVNKRIDMGPCCTAVCVCSAVQEERKRALSRSQHHQCKAACY